MKRFIDAIPAWREADAALDRLAGWRGRVGQALGGGDAVVLGTLIGEGRNLPLGAALAFLGDASGAQAAVTEATGRLDAAWLNDACRTLSRLCRSVNAEVKEKDLHPLDAADYPRLVETLSALAGRRHVPGATRTLAAKWREAKRRWTEERRQFSRLVDDARRLETERIVQGRDPDGRPRPLADSWCRDAESLLASVHALPDRDRHVRASGGDPDAFEAILDAIPGWLEADDAVREEADRADHLQRLRDATKEVLEQPVSTTIPWNGTEPLLGGDRLTWVDEDGRHDRGVDDAVRAGASGRIASLVLRPVEVARVIGRIFAGPRDRAPVPRDRRRLRRPLHRFGRRRRPDPLDASASRRLA